SASASRPGAEGSEKSTATIKPRTAALAELFEESPEELRRQALTHASWLEDRAGSYGRLAFLGDSVLGLAVAGELHGRFPDADSGDLTKIHNQAVSGRSCAEVARDLDIPERLGEHAPADGLGLPLGALTDSERPLAEVAEAVIGACFLAHGFEATAAAVIAAFDEQIRFATETRLDFKSELQERLARSGATVSYEVVQEEGPPHDRRFDVTAHARGKELGSGSGRSKKEAEQAAAEQALDRMRR
ncbi:MAG: ribonuclease III family protein, partial [Solirubrobacterales bacterium]